MKTVIFQRRRVSCKSGSEDSPSSSTTIEANACRTDPATDEFASKFGGGAAAGMRAGCLGETEPSRSRPSE